MKFKLLLSIILLFFTGLRGAETFLNLGFSSEDKKGAYLAEGINDYLDSLLAGKVEFNPEAEKLLKIYYKNQKNLFLASTKLIKDYQDTLNFDYSFRGNLNKRGQRIFIKYELFSNQEKRIILKKDFISNISKLETIFKDIASNIYVKIKVPAEISSPFGFKNSLNLERYLKVKFLAKSKEYRQIYEELDLVLDEIEKNEKLMTYYNLAKKELGYEENNNQDSFFDLENVKTDSSDVSEEEQEISRLVTDFIQNGYEAKHFKNVINKNKDSESFDIIVIYDIFLRKFYKKKILKEIKKRGGSASFADFNIYKLSSSKEENEQFTSNLLNQKAILSLLDQNGNVLFTKNFEIDLSVYNNGGYRYAKQLPFPLMPKGPADYSFAMSSKAQIAFIIEELDEEIVKKVKSSKINFIITED